MLINGSFIRASKVLYVSQMRVIQDSKIFYALIKPNLNIKFAENKSHIINVTDVLSEDIEKDHRDLMELAQKL